MASQGDARRETEGDRLIPIATAPNQPIADMWKGMLEDAGIPAVVQPMGLSAYLGSMTYCRILVRAAQAGDARRILGDDASAAP